MPWEKILLCGKVSSLALIYNFFYCKSPNAPTLFVFFFYVVNKPTMPSKSKKKFFSLVMEFDFREICQLNFFYRSLKRWLYNHIGESDYVILGFVPCTRALIARESQNWIVYCSSSIVITVLTRYLPHFFQKRHWDSSVFAKVGSTFYVGLSAIELEAQ